MRYFVTTLQKIWHLFVDDAVFAAAIVAWPVLLWLGVRLGVLSASAPAVLSVGYGVILYVGTLGRARRRV